MKKVLIGLLGMLLLTSCTERIECTNWKIVDIEVPENSWGWNDAGYYVATVDVPELDRIVYNDGFVQCYTVEGDYQVLLPYTRYKEDGNGNRWETTVDYEFAVGRVDFYCSTNDFVEDFPGKKRFRMVLHW